MGKINIVRRPKHPIRWMKPPQDSGKSSRKSDQLKPLALFDNPIWAFIQENSQTAPPEQERDTNGFYKLKRKGGENDG